MENNIFIMIADLTKQYCNLLQEHRDLKRRVFLLEQHCLPSSKREIESPKAFKEERKTVEL